MDGQPCVAVPGNRLDSQGKYFNDFSKALHTKYLYTKHLYAKHLYAKHLYAKHLYTKHLFNINLISIFFYNIRHKFKCCK
ncbi:MAG: hypothetical protein HQK66_00515 [Desulfamplus sp.]|nr:hypothetical protein [Desulfamplus sp.]